MPKITYIESLGTARTVDVDEGRSLMEGAVHNTIKGIDADCGGACSCATCHVYVDKTWRERVGPPNALEHSMLEFADGVQENSRLACQITVNAALDGLVVRIPKGPRG